MQTRTALMAVALGTMIAAPAWAGGRNQADQLPLQSSNPQVAQGHSGLSPADAQAAQRNRQQVQQLLDQLEAGKNVDPAEVERVLRQSLEND